MYGGKVSLLMSTRIGKQGRSLPKTRDCKCKERQNVHIYGLGVGSDVNGATIYHTSQQFPEIIPTVLDVDVFRIADAPVLV